MQVDRFMTVEELRARQGEIRRALDGLDATYAARKFPDEVRAQWNELNEEHDAVKERIEEVGIRHRRLEEVANDPARIVDGDGAGSGPAGDYSVVSSAAKERALRANDRASFLPDAAKAHMERALRADDDPAALMARVVTATADRNYYRAFAKWMRDPISGGHEWTPQEREAVQEVRAIERAMALGAGGTGGFLTPYELDPSVLIAGAGAISPLREIARVVTTAQNEKRFVTSLGVTSTWTPEAQEQTDDSPALLQPTITCKKGQAFVPVSFELFEDSSIASEIGRLFADAKVVHEDLSFTVTQTNGPTGIITALVAAGGSTVIATGTNVLAQGDLYANQAALPARWRGNAKWMMNLSILNGYRQLPQATGLNYSIIDDSGPRPKALGWEVYENSSMDGTLSGGAADYLVLSGDFQQFAIVDRLGTSIEVVQNLVGANHRPTGQRGFLMHYRSGSDVLIADAFRLSNFST